ncbi:uncharacterized protein [Argopecten irradians]|uniref:uncharacterized protein n=1 Tax=Argopecten irradians TaxID=31199 RepID=UPI003721D927
MLWIVAGILSLVGCGMMGTIDVPHFTFGLSFYMCLGSGVFILVLTSIVFQLIGFFSDSWVQWDGCDKQGLFGFSTSNTTNTTHGCVDLIPGYNGTDVINKVYLAFQHQKHNKHYAWMCLITSIVFQLIGFFSDSWVQWDGCDKQGLFGFSTSNTTNTTHGCVDRKYGNKFTILRKAALRSTMKETEARASLGTMTTL